MSPFLALLYSGTAHSRVVPCCCLQRCQYYSCRRLGFVRLLFRLLATSKVISGLVTAHTNSDITVLPTETERPVSLRWDWRLNVCALVGASYIYLHTNSKLVSDITMYDTLRVFARTCGRHCFSGTDNNLASGDLSLTAGGSTHALCGKWRSQGRRKWVEGPLDRLVRTDGTNLGSMCQS